LFEAGKKLLREDRSIPDAETKRTSDDVRET